MKTLKGTYKKSVKTHSRYAVARKILIFWTLFIGVGALGGAIGMFVDVSGKFMGMDALLPYFQVLPFAETLFQNFLFSGIALLIVNGLTNLTAAGLLFAKKKAGIILGGAFGVTLMAWITIQFVIFPANFMSTIYFIFGFLQAVTGFATYVFYKQETRRFSVEDYPNVGKDEKRLVVYFSRTGYVKSVAYKLANESGASVYEIKTPENTDGTLGFLWCGRFGMHRAAMPIEEVDVDLNAYDHVTIVTPIWVFAICAPVRTFCARAKGSIKEADYVTVHFTPGRYESAAKEMDELLGLEHTEHRSFSCKIGKFTEQK